MIDAVHNYKRSSPVDQWHRALDPLYEQFQMRTKPTPAKPLAKQVSSDTLRECKPSKASFACAVPTFA